MTYFEAIGGPERPLLLETNIGRCRMKKLSTVMLGTFVLVLCMGSCGTDVNVNWDDFFNEYYSECVQLCETCAEWADMCNVEDTIKACTERQWYKGLRNFDCNSYTNEVNDWIRIRECDPGDNWCLFN